MQNSCDMLSSSKLKTSPFCCRPERRGLPGRGVRTGHAGHGRLQRQPPPTHQAHAHELQAPPTAHHEVILCHQPQPRRQGPEAALAEDRPAQEGSTGELK